MFPLNASLMGRLAARIDELERRPLDTITPAIFDLTHLFSGQRFIAIRGLADFWSTHPEVDFGQYITDLVVGAHSQNEEYLTFILEGSPQSLAVYLSVGELAMTQAMVEGIIPGIELDPTPVTHVERHLGPHFRERGIITGVPSHKTPTKGHNTRYGEGNNSPGITETQGLSHLERVVRGMRGATWAYVVQAYPRPRTTVITKRLGIMDELVEVVSLSRGGKQVTTQEGEQATPTGNFSRTETLSGEVVNYRAQYLARLLEHELERLDHAAATGQWTVYTYFGAGTREDVERLRSLLVGTLTGKDSRPDPIRAYICESRGAELTTFKTPLSSAEVATLIQFPREEVPGYAIHDFARFDVDFRPPTRTTLALGQIQQNGQDTQPYRILLNDLTKHAVVLGVTGSGKTTTVLSLLDHAIDAGKPSLVIEPAKTEYRALQKAIASKADIRVYTLGNENVAPFRLNPFEFETSDAMGSAGGALLNHIDFLKAVFNAAFILYAPMPYVLETALHEVYEDKGWDLASGANIRLSDWLKRDHYPIFPTLTDLYRKVEDVTNRLGYAGEAEQTIKAGLKARIGSLRLGSKGLMLDTARGIPMHELLSFPTILELENIGNDDEKTFLMGLLLARLYEYRRLQAASGAILGDLQHLLVFEEAHRLLKNTSTQVDTESANPRAQAIEVFTNMLSEMRGYGQGVIVAEQIPSKLAPDVLKNTNLKIAHRLVAQDDRKSVGQTMNLNDAQLTHLGILLPGMAAVYAEGADHAYLVCMENYKHAHALTTLTDAELAKSSPRYASVKTYGAIPDLEHFGIRLNSYGGPEDSIYQAAGKLLETSAGKRLWASLILRTVFHRVTLPDIFAQFQQHIAAIMPHFHWNQQQATLVMLLVRGCAEMLHERGAEYGWTYTTTEELRQHLTLGLITLLQGGDRVRATSELERFAQKYKARLNRKQGAFAGCVHCTARCVYRPEVSRIVSQEDVRWIDDDLKDLAGGPDPTNYTELAKTVKAISEQWLGGSSPLAPDIGYCGALHAAAYINLSEYAQVRFGNLLEAKLK